MCRTRARRPRRTPCSDVDAAHEGVAGRGPGVDSTFQHGDIGVAEMSESRRCSQRLSRARVAYHHASRSARNEPGRQPLESRQGAAARVEEMSVVERAYLACIQERELLFIEDHAPQLVCGHCLHALPRSRFSSVAIQLSAAGPSRFSDFHSYRRGSAVERPNHDGPGCACPCAAPLRGQRPERWSLCRSPVEPLTQSEVQRNVAVHRQAFREQGAPARS